MRPVISRLFGAVLALTAPSAIAANPVATEDFARLPEFQDLALSPDGRYLAAAVPREDRTGIIVVDIDSMEAVSARDFGEGTHALNIEWLSDDRLGGLLGESDGSLTQPSSAGEIFAIDADGSTFVYLIGYRTRRQDPFYGSTTLVDQHLDDPKHAVISTRPFKWDNPSRTYLPGIDERATAERIHIVSGQRRTLVDAPVTGPGRFRTDATGFVRFFTQEGLTDYQPKTFLRTPEHPKQWRDVTLGEQEHLRPVSVLADGTSYLLATGPASTNCLYRTNGELAQAETIACRDDVDIGRIILTPDTREPLRAYVEPGRIESINLAPTTAEGKLLDAIQRRFAPHVVFPIGWSRDRNRLVFSVASDTLPGDVFLFDREKKQARFLLSTRQWIKHETMASREPIEYRSRDGLTIRGYLTRPPGHKAGKLPLVVLPHGGPIGVRDGWLWEPDSQFLASRGYAVLQVNFRGSGGYGQQFLEAGRRQWHTGMINDIVDGTRWAVDQGHADEKRICIYGASYGGYASLMSAIQEPDLYQCVVGYVGVYNLETMAKTTDITQSKFGREYFDAYIGASAEARRDASPLLQIDRLKAPMFIVHGEEDRRAPFSEAEALRAALESRQHPYEWMSRAGEGHGFYDLNNRIEFYNALHSFLNRHIGS
ncbi:MAG: S9 family peptidase [Pseudomonadota bacterium]|nr:S9 family peptidase [Pseudomonadota bacterium]